MTENLPLDGDVLVSNPTATVEYVISIVPNPPHVTCPTHDTAVAEAAKSAEERGVDVWLTEDHRHFMRLACHRPT